MSGSDLSAMRKNKPEKDVGGGEVACYVKESEEGRC